MESSLRSFSLASFIIGCVLSSVPACRAVQEEPPQAQAQSENSQATELEKEFDLAAGAHKVELEDLYRTRGVPPLVGLRGSLAAHRLIPGVLRDHFLPGTALLFYSFHAERLSVWLVTAEGIAAHETESVSAAKLAEAINNLRRSLGVESISVSRSPILRGVRVPKAADEAKLNLQQALLEADSLLLPQPIAEKLKQARALLVVPVLGLGSVPYALLQPFSPGEYLIDRMSVSVAPSLFDVAQVDERFEPIDEFLRHERSLTFEFGPAVVVGNPDLSADPDWAFPPLPGAAQEAEDVARMVGAEALTGRRATKANVLRKAREADFLYFATHGVADPDNPVAGSFLALSGSTKDEIHWTAKEIQSLRLTASLAVLSACQTGLGKSHDAGIIGLARAFQIAGVMNVVMSLWNVDDQATSQLMRGFISKLKSCKDETCIPAEALRAAILEFKQSHAEPKLWAPFVIFGAPR